MTSIYLDANATTPVLPEVVDAMLPFFTRQFGNPSSTHQHGQHARAAVDHARESVASLLRCRAAEILFTSGGTEGANLALFGTLPPVPGPAPHLITTSVEHHAVLHAAEALAARHPSPVELTILPVDEHGLVAPADLESAMRPGTRLVSVMLANNETGVVQPIAELARIAHAHGALFHTDAVQAAGKLPLDLSPGGPLRDIDLLSLSGHKMYAPQGTGVLFIRRGRQLAPLLHGGPQERGRRAGTENVPALVGLGRAAELAQLWLCEDQPPLEFRSSAARLVEPSATGPTHLAYLRDHLERGLLDAIPDTAVNSRQAPRTPNTISLTLPGVPAEDLLIALDLQGLACSAGSACRSGATEPSHVLRAMHLTDAAARSTIRLSLSRLTTPAEIERALELIPSIVDRLRRLVATPRLAHA